MKSHLLIWKLLIPPIASALLFMLCVDPERLENYRRSRMLTGQLKDVDFRENETGILIFGNSLLQHALPPDRVISRRINTAIVNRKAKNRRIKVSSIAVPGLPTIEIKKNLEKILTLRPKLIILQTELLFPNYAIQHPPKTIGEVYHSRIARLQRWARLTKIYLIPSIERIRIPAKTEQLLGSIKTQGVKLQAAESTAVDFQVQRIQDQWGARTIDINAPDYRICKEFIDRAHDQGIRIAILDMPVSAHTWSVAPANYLEERSTAVLRALGASDFYMQYPEPLPDDLYSDYSHLTVKGRSVFFRWMVNNFVEQYSGS